MAAQQLTTAARTDTRVRGAIAFLVAALLAALVPTGTAAATSAATTRVIVSTTTSLGSATSAVVSVGGEIVEQLAPFGMLVADVPGDQVDDLARMGLAVHPDEPVRLAAADAAATARPATEVDSQLSTIDAPDAWDAGATGEGVGVVLVDTGVAQHADLAGQVVAQLDLTEEANGRDSNGHGTFLAGLVAGTGTASRGAHQGVAPGAHLVSVKVAGADGETSLSQVLQGLVAADRARELYDAPVVLLALAGPASEAPDPLMIAGEMLWSRGSTVVVAAGNEGAAGVTSPGADPYLLTVGALDDNGTADTSDDLIPSWSSYGSPFGYASPDVVAPGTSVIGLRAAGSAIDRANPDARVDQVYFRGSGTSMAAAVTAGAAAAVLSANPGLTPDQVKGRLIGTASAAPGDAPAGSYGAGVIDVDDAAATATSVGNAGLPSLPAPGDGDAMNWDEAGWTWTGWTWTARGWDDWSFPESYFAGWTWTGWTWTGWTWTADEWAGWTWTDGQWAGWSWTGWSWTGWSWTGWTWSGWTWSGWSWS